MAALFTQQPMENLEGVHLLLIVVSNYGYELGYNL